MTLNSTTTDQLKERLSPDQIRESMESKYGYYSDSMIQQRAFLGLLNFVRPDVNSAQDIYAMCLEGPPGVGKTMFAKIYSKLAADIFNESVEFIDFTCTKDTGKTELIEEINVMAVVDKQSGSINIPGKIIEAIKLVNEGKRVILFIDEYDKARRETDSFFNSFLQSGSINAVQHGDLFILDEYKNNIQVIFCKNDPDVELSEAMQRRVRIIRLDYITPERFATIAYRVLYDNRDDSRRVNKGILDLVCLIYDRCYKEKDSSLFNRLPATSELLIAIEEASILVEKGNVPGAGVYALLMEDIFKDIDDLKAFESLIKKETNSDKACAGTLANMKSGTNSTTLINKETLSDILGKSYFRDQNKAFEAREAVIKAKEAEILEKGLSLTNMIKKYQEKERELAKKSSDSYQGPSQIEVNGLTFDIPGENDCVSNFQDESAFVKRSKSVFGTDTSKRWFNVAKATSKEKFNMYNIEVLIKNASKFGVIVYENGFLFKNESNIKVAMTRSEDKAGNYDYIIWSDSLVIPPSLLDVIKQIFNIIENISGNAKLEYSVDCLVYNERDAEGLENTEEENVYLLNTSDRELLSKIAKSDSVSSMESLRAKANDIVSKATNNEQKLSLK